MSNSYEDEKGKKSLNNITSVSQPDEISKSRYPRSIPVLLIQEFCERFSYYGFHAILILYLTVELDFNEYAAFLIFHAFMMLQHFSPFIAALIADSYLGRFWTIVHVSVWYAVGKIIILVGSTLLTVTAMRTLSLIGLILVALSSGGLKPCLSAFGGDQFENHQEKEREQYYTLFYFFLHFGNITASFLIPFLRSRVSCFESATCYPLAFGITALLNIIGTIVLILSKPLYRIIPVKRIFVSVLKCIGHALTRKLIDKENKKGHWLEYADDQYDRSLISNIKELFHVFKVYFPLAFFWTLYHQMGSAWVLQASRLDLDILGYYMPPDQMLLWHPALILILIPIFKFGVYPLFGKLRILVTPLQKMATGIFFCSFSFFLAGFVQLSIERDLPPPLQKGVSELTIINNSPCKVNITGATITSLNAFETEIDGNNTLNKLNHLMITPFNCSAEDPVRKYFEPETQYESLMITLDSGKLQVVMQNDSRIKLDSGYPRVKVFFRTDFEFTSYNQNSSFLFLGEIEYNIVPKSITRPSKIGVTDYWDLRPGEYKIYLPNSDNSHKNMPIGELKLKHGGSYIVAIYQNSAENASKVTMFSTYKWNTVPVLLQLPQYLMMSSGEIMFAISGISFTYTEAPASMKSIVLAVWFFIFGTGNVYLLIIKSFIHVFEVSNQYFIFAAIMFLDMLVFTIMAHFYKYANEANKNEVYLRGMVKSELD
ncbi:Solute carrier family 15 member 2 like protein [Argiope bruennichi]|uniref:Solute carrier family 15 member 2 like protein n=1 Tax=Argiope bruennichi TaxID=94029 RepID=A0A8T0FCJ7_ARGBR|nr:Solute carrier family 15 member 2 like protein [Argiope bruennichi]